MRRIAVSQKIEWDPLQQARCDALDRRWLDFFELFDFLPLLIPNRISLAAALVKEFEPDGILLTGGAELAVYGGDAPERDETEIFLLEYAMGKRLPLLGIGRGMQVIQHYFGIPLVRVKGQVMQEQKIQVNDQWVKVNSDHHFGTRENRLPLEVWAVGQDQVVKAIRHISHDLTGIMWHPERISPFRTEDFDLFNRIFQKKVSV